MTDDEGPDHTQDPREQGTGHGGYPEANPAAAVPGEGTDDGPEGERGRGGGDTGSDAPSPSTDKEADRARSTGNPRAAG
jgi:hypothetical protein